MPPGQTEGRLIYFALGDVKLGMARGSRKTRDRPTINERFSQGAGRRQGSVLDTESLTCIRNGYSVSAWLKAHRTHR